MKISPLKPVGKLITSRLLYRYKNSFVDQALIDQAFIEQAFIEQEFIEQAFIE